MALRRVLRILVVDHELFGSEIYVKDLSASCGYIANEVAYSLLDSVSLYTSIIRFVQPSRRRDGKTS